MTLIDALRNRGFRPGFSVKTAIQALVAALVLVPSMRLEATINSGEIIASSVTATVNSTVDPVNGVSVTFRWTTKNPSNSFVLIENPSDYSAGNSVPTRQVANNTLTTSHLVVVDHFPATAATWAYYVVSRQQNGTWASYPGPGGWRTFAISKYNANGPPAFTLWPVGTKSVYQGDATRNPPYNDLYVALRPQLLSGPVSGLAMRNATVTSISTGQPVSTITPIHLCGLGAPSNPPPQGWDGNYYTDGYCWNANAASGGTYLRLRVSANAIPGTYRFTATFQAGNGGAPVPMTWDFTVLPTASFAPSPPASSPPISALAAWQSNMVNPIPYSGSGGTPYRSGEWWCTNNQQMTPNRSIDNADFSGYFDISYSYSSNYFRPFNYDGGRVYLQIADYDYNTPGMPGYQDPNHRDHWKRCAQAILDPYKNAWVATQGGIIIEPNIFPFGVEMNYQGTGDPTALQALNYMSSQSPWSTSYALSTLPYSARATGYMMQAALAAEMAGQPRNTAFLPRTADILLGYLNQLQNLDFTDPRVQSFDGHPFMIGATMEALIDYYQLDLAEGNTPDARIPLEIKKTLDWIAANAYVPSTHTLVYNFYD